ncbi:ABC transporter permease [Thalassotalea fusca]
MQTLIEDIQFAIRSFMKTRAVSSLIVVTLALGIGANAAIFSMVHNVLFAPLPFGDGEQLVKVETNNPKINRFDIDVSVPTAMDYIQQNRTFDHIVEYHQMPFTLLGHGDPANVEAGVVSWDFFEMLSVRPILGRTFLPGEDEPGAKPLIVLSHQFWREKFGSDPNVVGKNLQMNNAVHQVIGVLPPLPAYPFLNDIWIGSSSCPGRGSDRFIGQRSRPISELFGKVKSGISLQAASTDINTISNNLSAAHPDDYPSSQGLSNTITPMRVDMTGEAGPTFYLLMGITLLVLLIACANVANLNLARTAARKQELAIREALGADPRRIARQVLTESVVLSLTGGILGLFIAYFSVGILGDFAALYTPLASEVKINNAVLIFCLIVSLLTGIVSGTTAAFQKRNINEDLKEGSGNITVSADGKRIQQALLVVQYSLSFIILTSAMLISLSFYNLQQQDVGFDATNVVAVDLSSSASVRNDFAQEVARKLEALPEIDHVGFSSEVPLIKGRDKRRFFQIEGGPLIHPDERPEAIQNEVSANFHQVMNIPLMEGRFLLDSDDKHSPGTVVVNQVFAREFFPDTSPIGQRISFDLGKTWSTIRGVVGDIREVGVNLPPIPTVFAPWIERWRYDLQLLVSSDAPMSTLMPTIKDAVMSVNPEQAIESFSTYEYIKEASLASTKLVGVLVSLFATLAFLITLSGVVGVVAYNVTQRRKEIGIRVALGANPDDIRKLFIIQGLTLCGLGLIAGVLIMVLIAPTLSNVLFDVAPVNLPIYLVMALIVSIVAVFAMLWPVKQATNVQPNQALREQ